jgi:hypothetical protein
MPGQFPESNRQLVFTPLCNMCFGRPVSTNSADPRPSRLPLIMIRIQNEPYMSFPFESALYNSPTGHSRFRIISSAPARHAIAMSSDTLHTQRTLSVSLWRKTNADKLKNYPADLSFTEETNIRSNSGEQPSIEHERSSTSPKMELLTMVRRLGYKEQRRPISKLDLLIVAYAFQAYWTKYIHQASISTKTKTSSRNLDCSYSMDK